MNKWLTGYQIISCFFAVTNPWVASLSVCTAKRCLVILQRLTEFEQRVQSCTRHSSSFNVYQQSHDLVSPAATHASAITLPPPCLTDDVVRFCSWVFPLPVGCKSIFISWVRSLFAFDSFRCFPPKSHVLVPECNHRAALCCCIYVHDGASWTLPLSVSDWSTYLEVFLCHGSNSVRAHLVFFCGLSGSSVLLSWPVPSFCWAFSLSDRFTFYFCFFVLLPTCWCTPSLVSTSLWTSYWEFLWTATKWSSTPGINHRA